MLSEVAVNVTVNTPSKVYNSEGEFRVEVFPFPKSQLYELIVPEEIPGSAEVISSGGEGGTQAHGCSDSWGSWKEF